MLSQEIAVPTVLPPPPRAHRPSTRSTATMTAAAGIVLLLVLAAVGGGQPRTEPASGETAATAASEQDVASGPELSSGPAEQRAAAPDAVVDAGAPRAAVTADPPLLQPAEGGDGDSWKDTAGREYRLGLVNTPEYDECFGSAATARRKELTAGGFRADVYASDTHGRSVATVTTASGVNLNVHLARQGFADDRYLERFRHENPALASDLDAAFTAAKAERAGLWGACSSATSSSGSSAPAPAPPPVAPEPEQPTAASGCHPEYATCIPVQGDGSGQGAANDLDCGDLRKQVQLRQAGVDPYRLDRDGDGYGCESYG